MTTRSRVLVSALGAVALLGILLPAAPPAHAATFTVTTTSDHAPNGCTPADCTLREAVIAANQGSGSDTVRLRPGTYRLAIDGRFENDAETGDLDLKGTVTVFGQGDGVIVDAGGIDRVFDIQPDATVRIIRVTIRGGSAMVDEQDAQEQDGSGGGILVRTDGRLELDDAVVTGNEALDVTDDDFGDGGGLSNFGRTTVNNSTIHGNEAESEGGGVETDEGTLTINNSTIRHNRAEDDGGGIQVDDGATLTLNNVTVRDNTATVSGGGIQVEDSTLRFNSGTVSGNEATEGDGGGIALEQDAEATLKNVRITNNEAGDEGGGLFVEDGSTATGTNTTVSGNDPDNCEPPGVIAGCAP